MLVLALLMGWVFTTAAGPAEPSWKIGRAIIQHDRAEKNIFVVKLSLRNEGQPGKMPVQILGRWKHKEESELTLLDRLTKEVALKQTAVVVISLEPLEPIPPGRPPLELIIKTGSRETDQKVIRLP